MRLLFPLLLLSSFPPLPAIAQSGSAAAVLIPQSFNAKGDGVTDDTRALNDTFAMAIKTGMPVFIPAGVYLCNLVTGGIVLNVLANANTDLISKLGWRPTALGGRVHGGLTIRGAGPGKTIIKTTAAGADLMAAISAGPTVYYPQYVFEDFTLQGPDLVTGGAPLCPFSHTNGISGNGLRITGKNSSKISITGVNAEYFCGTGKAAIWLDTAEEFSLRKVYARYSDIGLKLTTDTNASEADMVMLDANFSYGGYVESTAAITFNTLLVQSNCGTGLFLKTVGGLTFNSMYMENNNSCGNGHGIYAQKMTDSTFNVPAIVGAANDIYLDGTTLVSSRNHFVMGPPSSFQAGAKVVLAGTHAAGNTWINMLPEWFADPAAALRTETFINPVRAFSAGESSVLTPVLQAGRVTHRPQRFTDAIAAGCAKGIIPEGSTEAFSDSAANAWGAKITGGGAHTVLGFCDGKRWVVGMAYHP